VAKLVGTGLMPYKAQSPKISTFDAVSGSSVHEVGDLKQFIELHM